MKIKEGFVLREVAGSFVVLPLAKSTAEFNGMLTLNESGVLLWKRLSEGCTLSELVSVLTEEYEVNEDVALHDVEKFLAKIGEVGCIDMQ